MDLNRPGNTGMKKERRGQAMRIVNNSRSSPAADEADGREAPVPVNEKLATEVIGTRVEIGLLKAIQDKARRDGISLSAAARDALRLYVDHAPATSDRRQRAALLGELIQLRASLKQLVDLHEDDRRQGRQTEPDVKKDLILTIQAIEQAVRRLTA
ncbi:hypothetical protein [Bosea sp. (in: a-proteobacteria)]|uniref:hypothetical protein n=1 Tax=Bosea sp. (in: a-proteobacteria) TaxID=1871050 RepID=UPI0035627CCE